MLLYDSLNLIRTITLIFDTVTNTSTDLLKVECQGSILPRSCLVHTVNRFDSERWLSCNQVQFSGFLFPR